MILEAPNSQTLEITSRFLLLCPDFNPKPRTLNPKAVRFSFHRPKKHKQAQASTSNSNLEGWFQKIALGGLGAQGRKP